MHSTRRFWSDPGFIGVFRHLRDRPGHVWCILVAFTVTECHSGRPADPVLEGSHVLFVSTDGRPKIGGSLGDVVVSQPPLDGSERDAGIHPSGTSLTSQIV